MPPVLPEIQEEREQEEEDRAIALAYATDEINELKKHTLKHEIKAYALYFLARNSDDNDPPPSEDRRVDSSYLSIILIIMIH